MKKLTRRIVNNIRILEHATCTAGGGVIGLEDDIPKALGKIGLSPDYFSSELANLRTLSDDISEAAADLHAKIAEVAADHSVKIPTNRVVNTGGGTGKGP